MLDYWERKARLLHDPSDKINKAEKDQNDHVLLASIIHESIVDGPGMRMVLFTQGCPHRCPGCHNPQTHSPVGGSKVFVNDLLTAFDAEEGRRGVTLSGGEPFDQAASLALAAKAIHERKADVIVYTGYRLETLRKFAQTDDGIRALLYETDLLIDGPFIQARRSLEAAFVGSSNQRLIALSELGIRLLNDIPQNDRQPRIERIVAM